MTTINIHDARTQLSKLVEQAAAGNDVIIARGGKPVARLTRLVAEPRKLRFGVLKGKVTVAKDFDAPLPEDVLKEFEGALMRLLIDTHVFLWAASLWEIAIKSRLGKISGDAELLAGAIESSGFRELPVTVRHAVAVAKLPLHHTDPFD